jgi:hypothetical protein
MGGGRVTKYLVHGSLCSIAMIVGAQIYAVRELLTILLMLWLSFLVLWIGVSTFTVLCEMSWRGLNWLAARATPVLIRWRHPMVGVAGGMDSGHAVK